MWLKQNLHSGRQVSGNVRLNHRKDPALVLHPGGNAEVGTQPIIATRTDIGQRAATGKKLLADLLVPEIDLNSIARIEPIVGPRLRTLPRSAHPTSEHIAVVGVPV